MAGTSNLKSLQIPQCLLNSLMPQILASDLHSLERRKNMNKGDLVNEISKVVKTKKEAQAVVDCVLSSITKALENGDSVSLVGFGTFKVAERKARKGRNPQTGEEIDIAASKVPKFVAGKALKEAVK
jgi:DNA-binding protein HU-beta